MKKQKFLGIKQQQTKLWAGVLLAQVFLFYGFSKSKSFLALHASFFQTQKKIHNSLFSWIPFSAGDVLYLILFILIVRFIFQLIVPKNKRILHKGLIMANGTYFTYQILWGLLYFYPPISDKLPKHSISINNLKHSANRYLILCIKERNLVKEDKNGVFKVQNIEVLKTEISSIQKKLPKYLYNPSEQQYENIKPSLFSKLLSFTGILGYYNPFTSEAQYNSQLPDTKIPFTMCHENAHQLGFAREQEANFIGYLIGNKSENIELNYSAHYFVLKSLLYAIEANDPEFVKNSIHQFSDAMKRDLTYEKKFNSEHESWWTVVFENTNDWFLKANQQDGSISYSYFINLLIRYESTLNKPLYK
ncbi:MAG: DUF3810 domain-containing protein [Bacteroidetes bacterium]|nr:DUF3810 domain-containing protein [Bacteroidota bacterium]